MKTIFPSTLPQRTRRIPNLVPVPNTFPGYLLWADLPTLCSYTPIPLTLAAPRRFCILAMQVLTTRILIIP